MRSQTRARIMLTCPECSAKNPFPAAALVAGDAFACPHCGAELVLSHERDTPDGPPIWRLELPELPEEHPTGT